MRRILNWFARIFVRDVTTLLGLYLWRIATICAMLFGGIAFVCAAIIGGIFFDVPASTIFAWFTFTLVAMLLFSLVTGLLIFIVWFMRQNIWLLPISIILLLVITVFAYSGECYVIECEVCGERVCFDDPSELGTLSCPGKCSDCSTYQLMYDTPHTQKCGTRFDTACPTCGVENSFVQDSDFNHLYCSQCEKKYDMECAICGAVNCLIEMPDSDVMYCNECDNKFEMECSACGETNYLNKDADMNDLHCKKCNKQFYVECDNCDSKWRNANGMARESDIIVRYGPKPLRCTECRNINNSIGIAEESGIDVIRQFRLNKFIRFIDYKLDDLWGSVKRFFKL